MTEGWLHNLNSMTASHGVVVHVSLIKADGSTPREAGASMTVAAETFSDTIGGGRLEQEALLAARALLVKHHDTDQDRWVRQVRNFPLGPSLGQCCGGFVRLLLEVMTPWEADKISTAMKDVATVEGGLIVRPVKSGVPVMMLCNRKQDNEQWPFPVRHLVRNMLSGAVPSEPVFMSDWYIEPVGVRRAPLFLYGAGHVGRAIVKVMEDLPFEIFWIDTKASRFPEHVSDRINRVISTNPAQIVSHAPRDAYHVVLTYSHALDFEICRAVLSNNEFAYLGVIASRTKRVRFVRRLKEAGISQALVERLQAPIGLPDLTGKEPAIIALSLATDLLLRLQEKLAESSVNNTDKRMGRS